MTRPLSEHGCSYCLREMIEVELGIFGCDCSDALTLTEFRKIGKAAAVAWLDEFERGERIAAPDLLREMLSATSGEAE